MSDGSRADTPPAARRRPHPPCSTDRPALRRSVRSSARSLRAAAAVGRAPGAVRRRKARAAAVTAEQPRRVPCLRRIRTAPDSNRSNGSTVDNDSSQRRPFPSTAVRAMGGQPSGAAVGRSGYPVPPINNNYYYRPYYYPYGFWGRDTDSAWVTVLRPVLLRRFRLRLPRVRLRIWCGLRRRLWRRRLRRQRRLQPVLSGHRLAAPEDQAARGQVYVDGYFVGDVDSSTACSRD